MYRILTLESLLMQFLPLHLMTCAGHQGGALHNEKLWRPPVLNSAAESSNLKLGIDLRSSACNTFAFIFSDDEVSQHIL